MKSPLPPVLTEFILSTFFAEYLDWSWVPLPPMDSHGALNAEVLGSILLQGEGGLKMDSMGPDLNTLD